MNKLSIKSMISSSFFIEFYSNKLLKFCKKYFFLVKLTICLLNLLNSFCSFSALGPILLLDHSAY